MNWNLAGEIMRFILACCWIALVAVFVIHLKRAAMDYFIERVRWWK